MPTAAPVRCPSCGSQIPAADMELRTMAARCRGCDALVDLRGVPGVAAVPLPVPAPERVAVSEEGGGLRIVWRWYHWPALFMVFFCTLWWGFLAVWYAFALAAGNPVMLLVPVVHVAVGAAIVYWTAALLANRTEIAVAAGRLTVWHGPLPWPGKRDLATLELEQLYCEEHVNRGRNGITITYSVRARTAGGRMVKLAEGLNDRAQALFVEQEVERHLAIPDRPVASEVRR